MQQVVALSAGMLEAVQALVPPGAVVELRVPDFGGRTGNVVSGYYNDLKALVRDALLADGNAAGVYATMNPVKPELLARRVNRCEPWAKLSTADHDIERRRWILLDIDPVRAAGICATDVQHDAALAKAHEIEGHLTGLSFPEPSWMDSGNGAYLLYPVDLPNDEPSRELVHDFLKALAARFDDETIKIDTSVANAARIMRIPGTLNAKGDNTPERPHRRVRLLSTPEDLVTVDVELLAAVAKPERPTTNDEAPPSKPGTASTHDTTVDIEKMTAWLEEHQLDTRNGKPWKGTGYRWELESCPFNPDHDRGEAWVAVMPNGAKAAGCSHNSCTWKWSDLRAKVELESPADGPAPSRTDDGDRPLVDVRNDALAADWLREELGKGKLAGIFRRGDMLVQTPRIGEHGYVPSNDLGLVDAGPAQVRPITAIGIKSLIEARYECWKNVNGQSGDKRKRMRVPAMFPQQSAQSACESARLGEHAPNLKNLHGVTHTPMIRPDGTILHTAGYDAATGFLYLPDRDLKVYWIPDQPTPDLIRICVDWIPTPIAEFPFVSEDDRATWIGLLFTPILRPLLEPPYQLGVITATNPASGKTLLAKMIWTTHGGVLRGEMPRDADELRKSITAALLDTTGPVIAFDNLTGVIRSSVLEALLTNRDWTDRYLGQNKSVTAANDRLWLATGNNAQFGGDLARRIATVRLDPPGANHHLKKFKIADLDAWIHQYRGELLTALLIVARGWVVAGMPSEDVRSDGYARWVGGIRGLLRWAGFPGTFGGSQPEVAVSADDEEWHHFLVALHGAFGSNPFAVKDLVGKLGSCGGIDSAVLPGDLAEKWSRVRDGNDASFRKSLGWWLKNRTGRYAAGWSVASAGEDPYTKVARYEVRPPPWGH